MLTLPTATAVTARLLPNGLPLLREEFLQRSGMFGSALDPDATPGDPGLFGPDSPSWRLTGQPASPLVGLRAALLQTLSIPVPTAVHETGTFERDFLGRVARTGIYIQHQNLGSMDEVYRSARHVRAMHRTVKGTGKHEVAYDATDHHQQAWVSMTFTDSMLRIAEHYGPGRLSRADADRLVREQSTHAALLDHRVDLKAVFEDPEQRAALQAGELPLPSIEEGELPTTVAELRSLMTKWQASLGVNHLTRELLDITVELREAPKRIRDAFRPFMLATLWTMPRPLHDLVAPNSSRLEELAASQLIQGPLALLHAVVGHSPAIDVARARVAAA